MRVFFAIDIPNSICKGLQLIQCGIPGVKWTNSGQFHITLGFIENIHLSDFEELAYEIQNINSSSFNIYLSGIKHFGSGEFYSYIWATVADSPELCDLHKKIDSFLIRSKFYSRKHSFIPHVTLARIHGFSNQRILNQYLYNHIGYNSETFEVKKFNIYSSHLRAKGVIHRLECSYTLDGLRKLK